MSQRPLPRLARAVLRLSLPNDWRDDIIRDLEERYRERAMGAWLRAQPWLWSQIGLFCGRFLIERTLELGNACGSQFNSLDLRIAVRGLRRSPGLVVITAVSLAIGIGMAAGAAAVIKEAIDVALPFEGGDRIVSVQDYNVTRGYPVDLGQEEFTRRRSLLTSFDHFTAHHTRTLVVGDDPSTGRMIEAHYMTPGLLALTGVAPARGRLPDESDVAPGAEPVVVLPHFLWATDLGADPDALGRELVLGGTAHRVIGIMPAGFVFPDGDELWIPVDAETQAVGLDMIARLREGVSIETARAELGAVARPDPGHVTEGDEVAHTVTPFGQPLLSESGALWLLAPFSAVVLLLLVMATNVANLVLARNASRATELSVRTALGASRARVVGQLALEVGLLVAVAAALGLTLAHHSLAYLATRLELPFWVDLGLDTYSVVLALTLGVLTTFVAGVLPALRSTRGQLQIQLKEGGRGGARVRFGRASGALIVMELAICVGFLSAAAILGQSLVSFGFSRYALPGAETLVAQIYFGYPQELRNPSPELSESERQRIYGEFMAGVARNREIIRRGALDLPGARLAALGTRFPGNESETEASLLEEVEATPKEVEVASIGTDYFELLGVAATLGRTFTAAEHAEDLPVAVVNQTFVDVRLGGANPIGRRVRLWWSGAEDPTRYPSLEIVGVVPDIGLNPGDPTRGEAVYRPLSRNSNVMRLAVRGDADPLRWPPPLIDLIRRVDPEAQVQWTKTLEAQMSEPVLVYRLLGFGLFAFGALALVLSAASLHALAAFAVVGRVRELGVRRALGAGSARVVASVLRRTVLHISLGGALGAGLAAALLQLGTVMPWRLGAAGPWAIGIVGATLLLANGSALAGPLRRALSIHPAEALRSD